MDAFATSSMLNRVCPALCMPEQGWGVDINEEALKKYPPVNDPKTGMWSVVKQRGAATTNPVAGVGHMYTQGQQCKSRL